MLYNLVDVYNYRVSHNTFTGNILDDFSKDPLWPIMTFGIIGGLISSSYVSINTLTGILHSDSLKSIKNKTLKYYNMFKASIGNNKEKKLEYYNKVISYQKRLIDLKDSRESQIENIVSLGNLYKKIGQDEEAYSCYRKAMRGFSSLDNNLSYFEYLKSTFNLNKLFRFIKRLNKNEELETIFIDLLNNDINVLDKLKELSVKNENDPRYQYIYGKALDVLGFTESGNKQILSVAEKLIKQENIEVHKYSKGYVYLFKDNFFGSEIVARSDQIEERIIREKEKTYEIINILNDVKKTMNNLDDCEVLKPIGYKKINDKFWYIIERGQGVTLKESIEKNEASLEDFLKVANFMGLIHARVSTNNLKERDYVNLLKQRLDVEKDKLEIICNSFETLKENFSEIDRVYNKDSHFKNWIKLDYGGIMLIDIEVSNVIPLAYDAANLLIHHKFLTSEQRDEVIEEHKKAYESFSNKEVNLSDYKLAYLSSVIILAFELYTREFYEKEIKVNALENASIAIKRIENDFRDNYITHKKSYENLAESINYLSLRLN